MAKDKGKPVTSASKPKDKDFDIDALFAGKKKSGSTTGSAADPSIARSSTAAPSKVGPPSASETTTTKTSSIGKSNDARFTDLKGQRGRKRTDDGYAVYHDDELRLDEPNAGNTDACPFDCQCCF